MSSALCAKNCGNTIANGIQLPTTPVPDLIQGACGAYIASESQAQLIHNVISSAQADISQLDGEIHCLQALLDGLIHKRDALQTYTHSHTALVAPISRLPPEILSKIFCWPIARMSTPERFNSIRCPCCLAVSPVDGGPLPYLQHSCGHHLHLLLGQRTCDLMSCWQRLGLLEQAHVP